MLFQENMYINPRNIQLVSETNQALNHIMTLYLREGDCVIAEEPIVPDNASIFRNKGINLVTVPMDGDGICLLYTSRHMPARSRVVSRRGVSSSGSSRYSRLPTMRIMRYRLWSVSYTHLVAAVGEASLAQDLVYGLVLSVENTTYEDSDGNSYNTRTATIFGTDGNTYRYPVESRSLEAVSYTHLDVYKRQEQDYVEALALQEVAHTLVERFFHVISTSEPYCGQARSWLYMESVSYTHLDVYKRQAQDTAAIVKG